MVYNFLRITVGGQIRRIKCAFWVGESESIEKLIYFSQKIGPATIFLCAVDLRAAKSNAPNLILCFIFA